MRLERPVLRPGPSIGGRLGTYLSAEQLAQVTPWSVAAIQKMVQRGVVRRGVHYFQPFGQRTQLVFKWSAIVALIEGRSRDGDDREDAPPPPADGGDLPPAAAPAGGSPDVAAEVPVGPARRWSDASWPIYIATRPIEIGRLRLQVGDPFPIQDKQVIRGYGRALGVPDADRRPFHELSYVAVRGSPA